MPTLIDRINEDYKMALKAGERRRVDVLRLMKAAIQTVAIQKREESLEDKDVIQVLSQQAKQRRETIEAAKQGGREDILAQTTEELAILKSYLPEQLSEEALTKLVEEALQAVGSNRGQIMKYVMSKAGSAADGKTVNQLVGARLAKAEGAK